MTNKLLKTVFSLYYPETKELTKSMFLSPESLKLYEESYSEPDVQTQAHLKFKDAWLKWVSPQVKGTNLKDFYFYNTAGSSEAIRESLASFAASGGKNIFVFQGDYEGYKALAEAYGITTIEINRDNWRELANNSIRDPFYLSYPSSIDGNIWEDFEIFMEFMKKTQPSCNIRLDLCYVGTTLEKLNLDLSYSNIDMIFFSLSKVFGVYFHRIGGVFSRHQLPGLEGNRWFKNLFSLYFGIKLLESYPIGYIPQKYIKYQTEIMEELNQSYHPVKFYPSDVIFLAYSKSFIEHSFEELRVMKRHDKLDHYRYCLTALLDKKIMEKY